MFYIDSNVFLYPIIYDANVIIEAKKSKELLLKIAQGNIKAYTATITWDEIAWIIRRTFSLKLSIEENKKFLAFPNLKLLGVKKSTIFKAQELMENYRIKPRDAIHAAIALENKITNIVSYDKDFDELKEIKRIEP